MDKSQLGKRSRAAGLRFEKKVREDLESQGWIVSKWQNNIEWPDKEIYSPYTKGNAKIVPAKMGRFRTNQGGFPDFVCFKMFDFWEVNEPEYQAGINYELIFVESKMSKYLSPEEKEKAKWLVNQGHKLLIAYKEKEGRKVVVKYKEFENA